MALWSVIGYRLPHDPIHMDVKFSPRNRILSVSPMQELVEDNGWIKIKASPVYPSNTNCNCHDIFFNHRSLSCGAGKIVVLSVNIKGQVYIYI